MSQSVGADAVAAQRALLEKQLDTLRTLNAKQAPTAAVQSEAALLQNIVTQLAEMNVSKSAKKGGGKITLKTPKGTRDWDPLSMALRRHVFSTIERVFNTHGAVTIDTPVFELKEILSGKYGEDSKLIYDLQDQGGELCSLRYDLTVPFARFVAMNPTEYGSMKRYHIAKVYRRDQPAMSKGRFREFYQCDFDISGTYDAMIPDAEVLCVLVEVLEALDVGAFTIKVNHRKLLDAVFSICGVPDEKIRSISSAVDKLDKSPWDEVRREMVEDKGLDEAVADKIGIYVQLHGNRELLEKLEADADLTQNQRASEGLADMRLLFDYLDVYGILGRFSFDLSLARGLDYYTGLIYEAVTAASAPPGFTGGDAPVMPKKSKKGDEEIDESTVGVGSIAAGGRYDNLVGMFSGSKRPDAVPCVGVSVGVERVFSILMQRIKDAQARGERTVRQKEVDVYVMSMGDGLLLERMRVSKMLWDAGIKAEFMYKKKPKMQAQFAVVDKEQVPFAVMLAPGEWAEGKVRVKLQLGRAEESDKGKEVPLAELSTYLREKISTL
ncbi:histidine--tRNA ligase [Malassezia vespertilionis]|uniref:Histidine--tRNA ligase, mitochondrial n=1 Tax=Malassezia vespertilionis TaxID=2020962 RepID=A0A2N1J6Y9_9BASI|nr:histidine--tRNA ligase [Malassezia vespertilionis]PKI82321.1 Hts1p [Malassezia vespertilionis]WFD08137.1 histidine--tRNA ligase [Malassezia vespertilionis]